MHYYTQMKTPLGIYYLGEKDNKITSVGIEKPEGEERETELLKEAKSQLKDYFAGNLQEFTLPLAPEGTAFQKQVWKACSEIAYGKTRYYGELAERIDNPKAFRAVGTALGKNPIAIIIPCHRVLGKNGLGGYAGGLDRKRYLLDLERSHL